MSDSRDFFPEFVYDIKDGNPEFVRIIKDAISRFSFTELPEVFQIIFHGVKKEGAECASDALMHAMGELRKLHPDNVLGQVGDVLLSTELGEYIFKKIPDRLLEDFLPMNDVYFYPYRNEIYVQFHSLLKSYSEWGTTYYSRFKPTVEFNGERFTVAFSKHAIQQVCKRISAFWKSYSGLGDIYAYFELCKKFEPCILRDGSLAFTFYDQCEERFWNYNYIKSVLGESNFVANDGIVYYRVGYCPVAIDGEFAKAKTLLFPGFAKTPERKFLENSSISHFKKMKNLAENQTMAYLLKTNDFSIIRWFHENGVPQVIQSKEEFFSLPPLERIRDRQKC